LEQEKDTLQNTSNVPTAIFYWKDSLPTGAEGWVVLDRIINQISGGGIFMHKDATLQEVMDIARNMSYKFTVTKPQIGGAKAGIRFDYRDSRAKGVLRRFILDNSSILRNVWVTAGDLNTDDRLIEEIIQQDLGLQTYQAALAKRLMRVPNGKNRSQALTDLISNIKVAYFPLIGACVGYGVAKTIEFIDLEFCKKNKCKDPLKVAIQGFGVVGSSLAYYLQEFSIAKVVAIADKYGSLHNPDGLDIKALLNAREIRVKQLKDQHASIEEIQDASKNIFYCISDEERSKNNAFARLSNMNDKDFLYKFLSLETANVFSPCAMRYPITEDIAQYLMNTTWKGTNRRYLVGGANNMFGRQNETGNLIDDSKNLIADSLQKAGVIVVPDWVSNSGTAQLFHQVLSMDFDAKDPNVGNKVVSAIFLPIENFLKETLGIAQGELLQLFNSCNILAQQRLKEPALLEFDPSI